MTDAYHLAELNISRLLAPIDSELLRDFVAELDPVNAAGDATPGFVWRLQTEDGDATAVRIFDDPDLIVNLTVWTDLKTLGDFAFASPHVQIMRRRRTWFAKPTEAMTVAWWIPAGSRPTVPEAEERLVALRRLGPTPYAFTLRTPFPPPGTEASVEPEDRTCTV